MGGNVIGGKKSTVIKLGYQTLKTSTLCNISQFSGGADMFVHDLLNVRHFSWRMIRHLPNSDNNTESLVHKK